MNQTWTRETIYVNPEKRIRSLIRDEDGTPLPVPPNVISVTHAGLHLRFTPAFIAELNREKNFVRVEYTSEELGAQIKAASDAEQRCPACRGGHRFALYHGNDTGIDTRLAVVCECEFWRFLKRNLVDIPDRFKDSRLETLAPSDLSSMPFDLQEQIITQVRATPGDSFFLVGEPGAGKTHISMALYRAAMEKSVQEQHQRGDNRVSVWRTTVSVLLNQHIAWDTRGMDDDSRSVALPKVTEKGIQLAASNGYRPCLFLDEIDKIVPKDYKLNRLWEIVDAVYAANGQLVATSNKSESALAAKWGADEALAILRRIAEGPNAHTIRFFSTGPQSEMSKKPTSAESAMLVSAESDFEVEGDDGSLSEKAMVESTATSSASTPAPTTDEHLQQGRRKMNFANR